MGTSCVKPQFSAQAATRAQQSSVLETTIKKEIKAAGGGKEGTALHTETPSITLPKALLEPNQELFITRIKFKNGATVKRRGWGRSSCRRAAAEVIEKSGFPNPAMHQQGHN